jgi:hypothetical protein
MPGSALGRQHRWHVSAALRRGAAQPAHPADAVPATEIVAIVRGIMEIKAVPIYRGGAADAPGVGRIFSIWHLSQMLRFRLLYGQHYATIVAGCSHD